MLAKAAVIAGALVVMVLLVAGAPPAAEGWIMAAWLLGMATAGLLYVVWTSQEEDRR